MTRVTETRKEVQTQTESKIRTEEIRERTEGLTSESLPLSFPVAKVQKETRSRAWVPQLERSTLVRGGKGLNLILTPGDAMCLSPVEGPSGWGQLGSSPDITLAKVLTLQHQRPEDILVLG